MDKKSGRDDRKEIYNVNLMSLMQKTEGIRRLLRSNRKCLTMVPKLKLNKEISQDLAEISSIPNVAALNEDNFWHHPFLVAAKEWWDRKNKLADSKTGDRWENA